MARQPEPLFLERQNYRRRRLGDAARFLPVMGLVLFLMPILWSDTARVAGGVLYIFSVWAILIVIAAVLSRHLTDAELETDGKGSADPAER